MWIVGVKIAGIKILVPWTNLQYFLFPSTAPPQIDSNKTEPQADKWQEQAWLALKQLLVTVGFALGTYGYQRYLVSKREKDIDAWIATTAAKLRSRQKAEIKMIDGILYCNDGDWVESLTAMVEHADGRLEIVYWNDIKTAVPERQLRIAKVSVNSERILESSE